MRWLVTLAASTVPAAFLAAQTPAPLDANAVAVGAPTVVAELDLGKLHGEPRQLAWSPDDSQLYIQTADGSKPTDRVYSYIVPAAGGAVTDAVRPPEWATEYWAFKSDRSAPGVATLVIDVESGSENVKVGTGGGIGSDRTSNPGTESGPSAGMIEKSAESQHERVMRLTLLGQTIGEWVNAVPVPGQTFSWGPKGSGAIAFVDRDGRLFMFDQAKHRKTIAGVKDATLPAWTLDGTRLAYLSKAGRKKYTLAWVPISR
jgi:ribosomal protein L24E